MLMTCLFLPQVTEYLNSQESAKSARVSHFIPATILLSVVFYFFFLFFHFSVASSCSLSASLRNLLMPKQEYITTLITLPWKLSERKCILSSLLFLFLKMSHITLAVSIVPYGLLPTVCAGPFYENGGVGICAKECSGDSEEGMNRI